MSRRLNNIGFYLVLLVTLSRCAQVVPLSGGDRDTSPPQLIKSVPSNGTTNFSAQLIIFEFDEYVQLKDLSNEFIVSPRLETTPDVKASGKKILVDLKECRLRPNTTYRFSFGKAIADMNESNSMSSLDYVVSTGKILDTLKLNGVCATATDNQPAANMLAALYIPETENDSTPYIKEPDYLVKTKADGSFEFNSLPLQSYKLYVIADRNKNQLYDGETEQIAFAGREVKPGDSLADLKMFRELPSRTFMRKTFSPFYGFTQLIYNRDVSGAVEMSDNKEKGNLWIEKQPEDSISIFYREISDSLKFVFRRPEATDTFMLSIPEINKKDDFRFSVKGPSGIPAKEDKIIIDFPVWMDTSATVKEKIRLFSGKDSLVDTKGAVMNWRNIHSLQLSVKLREGTTYTLKPEKGAFRSAGGIMSDTIPFSFKTKSRKDFGNLVLKVKLQKKTPYVIQLLSEDQKVIAERRVSLSLSSGSIVNIDFPALTPANYKVKFIYDDNDNGRWDTGDVIKKKQPEKVFLHSKVIKIPSDWEVEEEISDK